MRTFALCISTVVFCSSVTNAGTVDLLYEDTHVGGEIGWIYVPTNNGPEFGAGGMFRLDAANESGFPGNLGDPVFAFCTELTQGFPNVSPQTYETSLDLTNINDPPNVTVGSLDSTKITLIRELFNLFYQPSWTNAGPFTDAERLEATAFHAALLEIVHEAIDPLDPLTPLNLDAGLFVFNGAWSVSHNDPGSEILGVKARGDDMLNSLSGLNVPPGFDLVAFTNPDYQDFIAAYDPGVIIMPEASTMILCSIGTLIAGVQVARMRKRRAS